MASSLGILSIDLRLNSQSFSTEMGKMSQLSAKTATDVKRSLSLIGTAGVAMASAIAAGTTTLIAKNIEAIGSLGRLSASSGTTAETFSVLSLAAKRSGVETELLSAGLQKLSKSAFGAQNGNETLANVFHRLGVTVTDSSSHLRDSGDLMRDVSTKFSGMANGAGKSALAMQLFGKSGAQLIPMLNELGKHYDEIASQAKKWGLVVSGDSVEKAHAFHESLTDLKAGFSGIGLAITEASLPALQTLVSTLQDVAEKGNIPDLAKSFGAGVSSVVEKLDHTLQFVVAHAHQFKIALEALAAVKAATMFAPLLRDLGDGGMLKVLPGVTKATLEFIGVGSKQSKAIKDIAGVALDGIKGLAGYASSILGLVTSEGIGATASLVFGDAMKALTASMLTNPFVIAAAAIIGLGVVLYKFRTTVVQVGNGQYQLRDIFVGAWLRIKEGVSTAIDWISSAWTRMTNFLSNLSWLQPILSGFKQIGEWIAKVTGKAIGFVVPERLLEQAKKSRESEEKQKTTSSRSSATIALPQPDTSGLGPAKKDAYGDEIKKLDLAIITQARYIAVLGATPDKIEAVTAAEKAEAIILDINKKRLEEKLGALTKQQEGEIRLKAAEDVQLESLKKYGDELAGQIHSTELSVQQTRALADATLQSDAAVRATAIDNAILALTYNRTAEQIKTMGSELAKLRGLLNAKSSIDLIQSANQEAKALRDEFDSHKDLIGALGQGEDVYRQAELAVKEYALNQKIATTTDEGAKQALIAERNALEATTKQQWALNDAQQAYNLLSDPTKTLALRNQVLDKAVVTMKQLQGGQLPELQTMQVAAERQKALNDETEKTIDLLTKEGTAADGVRAFFLKMQEQAKTAAAIIYKTLNSAFEKLSDQLTKLLTGQKTDFGKMFKELGESAMQSTIKSGLQQSLGALSKKLGIGIPGIGPKADGSKEHPFWVNMANGGGKAGGGGSGPFKGDGDDDSDSDSSSATGANSLSGLMSGILGKMGGLFSGVFSKLGGLFSGLFGGAMADGGSAFPSSTYLVGERGPELFSPGVSGQILSHTSTQRVMTQGAGGSVNYTIDARGTDSRLVDVRTKRAIQSAHNSAVSNSARLQSEQARRNPR